jgi:peptidoglycan/xylan/chitin deacetylase (PgdA/CDA1 family)
MRLFRPGFLAGCLYPDAVFRIKTAEKVLYLTFDDGPDPLSTPQLLDILRKHEISALFFCTGAAAEEYPELVDLIRSGGHQTGNHGYSHPDGWKTDSITYVNDVKRAAGLTSDKLFRPPFGRISFRQKRLLKSFKIVFWDLMAYDFDSSFGSIRSLGILKRKIRPGSIIVLHDTATSCAKEILEEFIKYAFREGYRFGKIENIILYEPDRLLRKTEKQ